jgi:acyl carrier protein
MPSPAPDLKPRVMTIVSRVFRVPLSQVNESSSPETIASWDSLLHMQLVLALEEEFKVQFGADDIIRMQRVDHILDVLKSKL